MDLGGLTMNTDQAKFLKDEFFSLTLMGTVQRADVYARDSDSRARNAFQRALRRRLEELAPRYRKQVTEEEHIKNIKELSEKVSAEHGDALMNRRFRIGPAQKALNLYLKYLWCIGEIPPPPHCPFDYWIIQEVLGLDMKWTCLDDFAEYWQLVEAARKKAKAHGLSLPEWELKLYNET
jgi:hypothetical protein